MSTGAEESELLGTVTRQLLMKTEEFLYIPSISR
jgi:hypothetical protein